MEYHNTVGIPLKVNEKKILQFCRIKSLVGKINPFVCTTQVDTRKKCIRKWDIIKGGKYHMILNKVTKSIDFNI